MMFTKSSARPLGIFCVSHKTSMRSDFVIVSSSPAKSPAIGPKTRSANGNLTSRPRAIRNESGGMVFPEHGAQGVRDLAQRRASLDGLQDARQEVRRPPRRLRDG